MFEDGKQASIRLHARVAAALALTIFASIAPVALGENNDHGLQYIDGVEDDAVEQWVEAAMEPRHAVAVLVGNIKSKRGKLYDDIAWGKDLKYVLAFGAKEAKGSVSLTVYAFRYPPEVYEGKWTTSAITAWLFKVGYPLLNRVHGQFSPPKYFRETTFGVVLVVLPLGKQTDDKIKALETYAEIHRDKLKFTFFPKQKELQEICDAHGVLTYNEILVIEDPHRSFKSTHTHKPLGPKYRLENPTPERIETFFQAYAAGTWPRYFKPESAVRPAEPVVNGGVRELSGWDFTEVVSDPERSVLVTFTSANCSNCLDFAPIYAVVARTVQDLGKTGTHAFSDIVIARIDHSKNEHSEEIRGTPWLRYWPKGRRKKPVDLDVRAADKILAFLEERAADEGERDEL